MVKKIEATEMWFYRRMLRVPWTARKTNKEILEEADAQRGLMNKIRKRQTCFIGHVIRMEGLEHLATTGKLDGRRARGRQREKIMDSVTSWIGKKCVKELIRAASDRDDWRDMIANAVRQGT